MRIKPELLQSLFWIVPSSLLRICIALMFHLHGSFVSTPLFLPSLLGHSLNINFYITPYLGLFSVLIFYLICSKTLDKRSSFWATLIYAILPINAYNDISGSPYSYYLFFLLLITYSLMIFSKTYGKLLFLFSSFVLACSSVIYLVLLVPLVFAARLVIMFDLKIAQKLAALVLIPLAFISILKSAGLKNSLNQNFSILTNIGIVNTVNTRRGESQYTTLSKFSKLIENRYVYSLEVIISNTLSHFSLGMYFTPRIKILNFSFTPPFESAFIIPFLYYLYSSLKKDLTIIKFMPLILMLFSPSIFSQNSPNIQVLGLVSPFFSFIFYKGLRAIKNLWLTKLNIGLIAFQFLFILADMFIGENLRVMK